MRIDDLIVQLKKDHPGWSNGKIAEEVRHQHPNAKTTPVSVSSTLSRRSKASWPSWPEPSEDAMVGVAHAATPLVRFLHPEVIAAVVTDNRRMSCEWSRRLKELNVDPDAYLWDGSACTFPGIRRPSGRKDHGTDCVVLDRDNNTYPKHLWAYTLTGCKFNKCGPRGYNLAHLFDHKVGDGRFRHESVVAADGADSVELHGLFTSAATPLSCQTRSRASPTRRRGFAACFCVGWSDCTATIVGCCHLDWS